MADRIPANFLKSIETAIASFDFTDIASGSGIINFYLSDTVDLKVLTTKQVYSNQVVQQTASVTPTSDTKVLDVDFDVEFQNSITLEGGAVLNIPFGIYAEVAAKTYDSYLIVKVRKWTGSVETEIVNNQGDTITLTTVGINEVKKFMNCIDLDIPKTTFKKGETLRLTVEQWGMVSDGAATAKFFFGHDPRGRATTTPESPITFGTDVSTSNFFVPVRIDL